LIDAKTREFTDIYSDMYPLVYNSVYTRVGNVDDVMDICQEVFIRLFDKYEEVDNPRKWLLGTMRFVVLEYYRRKGSRDITLDEVFNDMSMTFVNGFRDSRLIIEEAMENMELFEDEKGQTLFHLIAINSHSYREAGELLGLSVHKVRYKYEQIVNRVIAHLKKKGIKSLDDLL
jgi:RNA polymerase sigma factor (sigma-70 family)